MKNTVTAGTVTASKVTASEEGRLSFWRKAGYGLGGAASNIIWQMVNLFLLYFYTDVFGISGAIAGVIFLAARFIDAVTDPVMGYIADHTRSRWGKFRPYILFGSVPLGILYVLTFTTPDFSESGKIIYAFVTYIILGSVTYTMVNIPFNSLMATITQNPNERSELSSFNLILSQLAVLLISIATKPLIALFPNERIGFTVVVGIYAVLSVIMFIIVFISNKEKVYTTENGKYKLKDAFKLLFRNKFLLLLATAYLFSTISGTIRNASAVYYFKYNVGNEALFSVFMLIQLIGALPASALAPVIAKKMGSKRNLMIWGSVIFIIGDLGVLLISFSIPALFFLFNLIIGIGGGFAMVMNWSMIADTVEYGEWKTGMRGEGIIYSSMTFISKLAAAIGGILSGTLLSMAGYVPNQAQSPAVLSTILNMLALYPIITGIIGICLMIFYKLDDKTFNQIVKEIRERNSKK
jgi:sugar (glycoside-pentoside-hexuronide) transporter